METTSEEFNPNKSAKSIPAADISANVSRGYPTTTRTYAVKHPEEDQHDFMLYIQASKLQKCRKKLQNIKETLFPFAEVLLGVTTLCVGATLSALTTDIKLDSSKGIIFFILLPVVAVGCSVAFFFYRHYTIKSASQIAADVLEDLPDPDKIS